MEKLEQNFKILRHHRVQHTITVQNLLTIGLGIEKSGFFLLASVNVCLWQGVSTFWPFPVKLNISMRSQSDFEYANIVVRES